MKTSLLIVLCILGNLTFMNGQIAADSIKHKLALVNNRNVQSLSTDIETRFETIKESKNWKPYDSTHTSSPDRAIWLKFEIENKSADTLQSFIYSNDNYVTTYQQVGSRYKISKNGNLFALPERTNKSEYFFTKLVLAPFQKSWVYVRLNSDTVIFGSRYPTLYSEKGYWQLSRTIRENQSSSIGFIYFYIIALITIFMFALVFWLRLRKKLYLYYLGYLFFQLIYGFQVLRTTTASVGNILSYIPKLSTTAFQPVQFVFIGFYIFFTLHLLTIRRYDRRLAKTLYYLGIFCFVYAISHFVFSYFFMGHRWGEILFVVVRAIILPLNFVLIIWIIYKVKHPLLNYFIVGQSFFFVGAVLASYVGYSEFYSIPGHFFNFTQAPNIIFQMGLLAEVFCFSLALGKNMFLLQQQKQKATAKLIHQLQENKLLQERMNVELDKKVNEKTTELIQLYSQLEAEKEEKIKSDFSRKLKETEMVALRSQMNPHFIFNSLSAIKHLIMAERNDDAVAYLDDFSGLLRGILQSSNLKKITVEEELEILELYLSLEKNRIGPEFKYEIHYESKEALSQYYIPPLLLQPIVENALWHGLQPSLKAEKKLKVVFDTKEDLKIIIEDNGIGRPASLKKRKLHNSMGGSIIQDRLTLYNHLNDHSIYLKTTDLEKNGNALGTRVVLTYQY